jgi:hypothetical protein
MDICSCHADIRGAIPYQFPWEEEFFIRELARKSGNVVPLMGYVTPIEEEVFGGNSNCPLLLLSSPSPRWKNWGAVRKMSLSNDKGCMLKEKL